MFAIVIQHFQHRLIVAGKDGAYQSGALTEFDCNGRLVALPTNIRLRWKWVAVGKHSIMIQQHLRR